MLSIIVCSINPELLSALTENISRTAGVPYELLAYRNMESKSLCEVYNRQAANAKYSLLCFVHEDVFFLSNDWGKTVAAFLEKPGAGVGGLMGSRYKSAFGLSWHDGATDSFRMQIETGAGEMLIENPFKKKEDEVICLDGAFLCCTKQRWEELLFDEKNFRGFHYYDLDFSLQAHRAGFSNAVLFEVVARHASSGKKDALLLHDFFLFQKKWAAYLPQSLDKVSNGEIKNLEGYALSETLALMNSEGLPAAQRLRQLCTYTRCYKSLYHFNRSLFFGFLKLSRGQFPFRRH